MTTLTELRSIRFRSWSPEVFIMWSEEFDVYTLRVYAFTAQLKGPGSKPLFSERYRLKMLRVPLRHGWRIIFRWEPRIRRIDQ